MSNGHIRTDEAVAQVFSAAVQDQMDEHGVVKATANEALLSFLEAHVDPEVLEYNIQRRTGVESLDQLREHINEQGLVDVEEFKDGE